MRGVGKAILVALAMMAGGSALAADLPTKKEPPAPIVVPVVPNGWQYEFTAYLWAPSVAGSSGFGSLPTLPYYLPAVKALEHFQGGLMSSFVARNDMFIGGLDFIWSRLGGSGTISNESNALYGGQTDLKLNEVIVTAFGGVKAPIGVPNLDLYATIGARNYFSGTKLTVSGPLGLFQGTETVNKDWIMPVAGFAAQYRFTDQWFMNMLADIGGWSNSATGQALASVGYKWTPNIATTVGYRVMYTYDKQDTGYNIVTLEPKSFRYQQWMYGPFAGFKVMF